MSGHSISMTVFGLSSMMEKIPRPELLKSAVVPLMTFFLSADIAAGSAKDTGTEIRPLLFCLHSFGNFMFFFVGPVNNIRTPEHSFTIPKHLVVV